MPISADTIVVGVDPYDIPYELFRDIQVARNSPAAGEAHGAYSSIATNRVSIAFALAVFNHESQMATDPAAIVVKYNTRNPGNCRSLRADSGAHGTVIDTPRGEFVQYQSWTDGWRDLSYRLVDPHYAYVQEGRRTIRQIIERFAPSTDSNDPDAYVNAVVKDMNTWIGSTTVAGDDPRFTWAPDTEEFGYPQGTHGRNGKSIDYLIIHVTEGTDSAAWLRGNNGSSTHYLTKRDGTPREQHVAEADAAWTPGNGDYAQRSINIEFERFAKDPWTSDELANAVATCAPIIARHNIPAEYLGKDNAGKRGIIGHQDVPDPNNPGQWGGSSHHGDPGPKFPWGAFIAALKAAGGTPTPQPAAGADPVTGKYIHQDFATYFAQHGGVDQFGRPVSGAFNEGDRLTQYFERAVMQSFPENKEPYKVQLRLLGAEELKRRYPNGAPA